MNPELTVKKVRLRFLLPAIVASFVISIGVALPAIIGQANESGFSLTTLLMFIPLLLVGAATLIIAVLLAVYIDWIVGKSVIPSKLTDASYDSISREVKSVYGIDISRQEAWKLSGVLGGNFLTGTLDLHDPTNGQGLTRYGIIETLHPDGSYIHAQLARVQGEWKLLNLAQEGLTELPKRETVVAF